METPYPVSAPAVTTPQRGALYTQHDIIARGSFSKSHLYNLIARGHFPAPALKMGPRFTRWSATDVDSWFENPAAFVDRLTAEKSTAVV